MSIMHANIGLFLFCTNIEIWTNCPRKNDMFEMYLHDIIFADELQHKRDGTLTIPLNHFTIPSFTGGLVYLFSPFSETQ